jgi:DNA mismatch endonuclease (patch repair protein)
LTDLRRINPPAASSVSARRVMSANRGTNTRIEMTLRRALWKSNLRGYRVNWRMGPRRADICYPRKKIVVLVHGCFWHKCAKCSLHLPRSNRGYWSAKLAQNQYRDRLTRESLEASGWQVVEVWEHEIIGNLSRCVTKVSDLVRRARLVSLQLGSPTAAK